MAFHTPPAKSRMMVAGQRSKQQSNNSISEVLGGEVLSHVLQYARLEDALALRQACRATVQHAHGPYADFLAKSARSDACTGLWHLAASRLCTSQAVDAESAETLEGGTRRHQIHEQAEATAADGSEHAATDDVQLAAGDAVELMIPGRAQLPHHAHYNGGDDADANADYHMSENRRRTTFSEYVVHNQDRLVPAFRDGLLDSELAAEILSTAPEPRRSAPLMHELRMRDAGVPAYDDAQVDTDVGHTAGVFRNAIDRHRRRQNNHRNTEAHVGNRREASGPASISSDQLNGQMQSLLRISRRAAPPACAKDRFSSMQGVIMWMVNQVCNGQHKLMQQLAPIAQHASAEAAKDLAQLLTASDEPTRHMAAWTMLKMSNNALNQADSHETIAAALEDSSSRVRILAMCILDRLPAGAGLDCFSQTPHLSLSAIEHALEQEDNVRFACARVLRRMGMASTCADITARKLSNDSPTESVRAMRCLLECGSAAARHTDAIAREIACDDASTHSLLCQTALSLLRKISENKGRCMLTKYTRILVRGLQRSPWWHTRELLSASLLEVDASSLIPYTQLLSSIQENPLELWVVKSNIDRALARAHHYNHSPPSGV